MALEVVWACQGGHHRMAHKDATGLWCPESGHKGTNAMKPRDRFPSWSPDVPAEGWGRSCCRTYPDEPHRAGCRYFARSFAELEIAERRFDPLDEATGQGRR